MLYSSLAIIGTLSNLNFCAAVPFPSYISTFVPLLLLPDTTSKYASAPLEII